MFVQFAFFVSTFSIGTSVLDSKYLDLIEFSILQTILNYFVDHNCLDQNYEKYIFFMNFDFELILYQTCILPVRTLTHITT